MLQIKLPFPMQSQDGSWTYTLSVDLSKTPVGTKVPMVRVPFDEHDKLTADQQQRIQQAATNAIAGAWFAAMVERGTSVVPIEHNAFDMPATVEKRR